VAQEQSASAQAAKDQKAREELARQQAEKEALAKAQKTKEESERQKRAQEELLRIQKANPTAGADVSKRKLETIRTVVVAQDSLVFSLYDNGTVDGDTVSVLINGKVVIPRLGLLERAYNKTIYLTPDMGDSISVVLYAENLGSIPPNTGLLVIREGSKIYEIRFSGDMDKNSKIVLIRKKNN
jgi:Flp pilus assembly protein TadB